MRRIETEHATPIAIPRLMPGSDVSVSRMFSLLFDENRVECRFGFEFGSATIVQISIAIGCKGRQCNVERKVVHLC